MWSVTSAQRRFGLSLSLPPPPTSRSGAAGLTRYDKTYRVFAVCRAAGVCLVKPDWYCGVKLKGPLEFHLSGRLVESSRKIKGRKSPALELPLQAVGGTKRPSWARAASHQFIRSSSTAEKQLVAKMFTPAMSHMGDSFESIWTFLFMWMCGVLVISHSCFSHIQVTWVRVIICATAPRGHANVWETHGDILFHINWFRLGSVCEKKPERARKTER